MSWWPKYTIACRASRLNRSSSSDLARVSFRDRSRCLWSRGICRAAGTAAPRSSARRETAQHWIVAPGEWWRSWSAPTRSLPHHCCHGHPWKAREQLGHPWFQYFGRRSFGMLYGLILGVIGIAVSSAFGSRDRCALGDLGNRTYKFGSDVLSLAPQQAISTVVQGRPWASRQRPVSNPRKECRDRSGSAGWRR